MTGDERLAKVAEVLAATVRSMGDDIERQTCAQIGADLATDLAPLLDEFRAEDEARVRRQAISVMDSLPNHNDLYHMHLNSLAAGRAEAWDEGAHAATQDYGIGVAENPYRAALAAAEPDAGERPVDLTRLNYGICPKCGEDKFIGHGPWCIDCFTGGGA